MGLFYGTDVTGSGFGGGLNNNDVHLSCVHQRSERSHDTC